jgi:spore germination protein KC
MGVIHRMRKTMVTFIVIMLFSLTLLGCWDIKYLDNLSIVVAIGMDTSEDQEVKVTVQVMKPSEISMGAGKGGGSGKSSVTTFSGTGQTVFEAEREISNITSRKLYFSHNQVLVIGEEFARKGIDQLFDFIERDPEIRTDFYVLIAKGATASDILKIITPIEKVPGKKIHNSIDNAEKYVGTSYSVTMKDIIENISSQKKEIMAGSIEIVGDKKIGDSKQNADNIQPLSILKLNGMAVFKDEKLVSFFSLKDSRGIAWIKGKVKDTVINIPCEKEKKVAAIEVIHSSTKIKAKFQQDQPSIVIRVKQEANIGEVLCPDLDLSDQKTIDKLENGTEEQIKKEILSAVKKAQHLKTDIFSFADVVYKANPAYWKKNKQNWDDIFNKVPVQVEVDTQIRREGARNKPYYKKVE